MSWEARLAAADLLADMVVGGGEGAAAAVSCGAYAALVESLNRDTYPYLNQVIRSDAPGALRAT
jgi:hypothetical protein